MPVQARLVAGHKITHVRDVRQRQVYVQQVYSNTPAADAGFQNQDVLVRICTNEIRRSADVLNTIFYYRCGESAHFTVLRDGKPLDVTLIVGKRPAQDTLLARPAPPGLVITPAATR